MQNFPEILTPYLQSETVFVKGSVAAVALAKAKLLVENELPIGLILAACFDLVVASKFYRFTKPENWLWCKHGDFDIYPILNACPLCVLQNHFIKHNGNKPSSGSIGPSTSQALREILVAYYHLSGKGFLRVFNGSEPADLVVIDSKNKQCFIAEVKASPLFTPPLAVKHASSSFQTDKDGARPLNHFQGTLRNLHTQSVSLIIPQVGGKYTLWKMPPKGLGSDQWPDNAIITAIRSDEDGFKKYLLSWVNMWNAYAEKNNSDALFYFTGACGLPRHAGDEWEKSSNGKPVGTISDGKTSVGMDRTDDIKKSTFQMLKLGIESRNRDLGGWALKIGLASNLHAARHHETYLKPYEDIVWGWSPERGVNPADWYNLFDGIVSFSKSHTRDEWIQSLVAWHENDGQKP
ncbi:MAG: hypothetical protein WCH61_02225 [bacterium]